MVEVEGKSAGGIISIERSGREVITLDTTGRLLYFSNGMNTWKRSLDNRFIRIGWDGEVRILEPLSEKDGEIVTSQALTFLRDVSGQLADATLEDQVARILSKDSDWLIQDARKFHNLYSGQFPIIPQDQRFSIYLQLTYGNVWNAGTFAYPGDNVGQRSEDEFSTHIKDVMETFGEGMNLRRGAFLGDVAALGSEQKPLLKALDAIRSETELPIYGFVDSFHIPKKNMIHYQDMKRHGLSRVYLGIQSGSVSLLRYFEKLKNVSEILNLVNNLKNSGISVGLIILTGYGGNRFSSDHVEETAAIISQMDLDEGDIIYLTPMEETSDPRYKELLGNGTFDVMDSPSKEKQADAIEKRIKEEFRGSNRTDLRTQISRYDIREGIY